MAGLLPPPPPHLRRWLAWRIHPSLLPIQVEFANRQLRELGKFQVATDALKGRETFHQNPADLSADSLDLSLDEAQPLNSTRYRHAAARRSPSCLQHPKNPVSLVLSVP